MLQSIHADEFDPILDLAYGRSRVRTISDLIIYNQDFRGRIRYSRERPEQGPRAYALS